MTKQEFKTLPEIQNGLEYILAHDEHYRVMVKVAKSDCPI